MAKYPTMDWVGENIAESFKMFKQRMSLILLDENIVDPAKQAIKIQIAVGTEGLQRLNASTLTDEDKKDPTNIYKLFDDQLDIKVNFLIEGIAAGKQSLQSLKRPHHTVNEVKRRNVCMNCAVSHPARQCPVYKDHCKYCDGIGHWEKWCRKKKSDSRQKSGGRRQKVVYRQQQNLQKS